MISADNIRKPTRASPQYLAAIRIILALWVLYESLGLQFRLFSEVGGTDQTLTVFPPWVDDWISGSIWVLLPALQIFAVLSFLGFLTAFSTWALFLTYLLVYSFHYSFFDAPVPWLYGWFPLLVLALSQSGHRWSVDSWVKRRKPRPSFSALYGWPLDAIRLWFVYIYVSAGISKIFPLSDFPSWVANSPTQEILVFRYPHSMSYYLLGRPLVDYSAASELISVGALLVVFLELSILAMVFTDKFDYFFISAVFSMHGVLWLVGVPNFGLASLILVAAIVLRKKVSQVSPRNQPFFGHNTTKK